VVAQHIAFAVPGDLATPTGGYAYDRRIIAELRALGWQVDVCNIGDGFPRPSAAQFAEAHELLAEAPAPTIVIDGLAFGVMDDSAAILAKSHTLVALVHHPLALETGLEPEEIAALWQSECTALAFARHIIVPSPQTAEILVSGYSVARKKITVATPGNDPLDLALPKTSGVFNLLSVGSVVPRKGYDVLIAALATLADLPWHLTIVGDDTRSPPTTAALHDLAAGARLADKISFRGALSDADLAETYQQAHLYVTASHFEGYGMAAATAIACGLPIVATSGGALQETVGDAGLLVPPNDVVALADALRSVISKPDAWMRLRDASRTAAKKLPTWRTTAEQFARAIETAV
jgi:glycosyltransferase involved in cell wall biosynthesis